jgi:hypothetical protein
MTQEDRDLLFKDICARLPYKPKCNVYERIGTLVGFSDYGAEIDYGNGEDTTCEIQHCYLYLRPMSSMTKEELYEVQNILGKGIEIQDDFISIIDSSINSFTYLELQAVFDWLNAHYFDYRGLIKKGLALEALKDMYK